jgi:hypothetical protein
MKLFFVWVACFIRTPYCLDRLFPPALSIAVMGVSRTRLQMTFSCIFMDSWFASDGLPDVLDLRTGSTHRTLRDGFFLPV